MSNHPLRFALVLLAGGLIAIPPAGAQQSRYRSVEARDLLERPQNYWARPIIFQDTLIAPPDGRDFKLEGVRYATFSTKTLGTCYVVKPLEPILAQVPADRDYMFSGTVLQRGGRYYVIVESFSGTVDSTEIPSDLRNVAASGKSLLVTKSTQPMADILRTSQESIFAYAKEKDLNLDAILEPGSDHAAHALELIRVSVRDQEQKLATSSAELIAQYVYGIIIQNQPALRTPGESPEAAEPEAAEPEAEAVEEESSDEEAVDATPEEGAPPKVSWRQRWSESRAKEAALEAEQERQAREAEEKEEVAPAKPTRAEKRALARQKQEEDRLAEEKEALEEAAAAAELSLDAPVPAVAPEPEAEQPPVVELPPPEEPVDAVPAERQPASEPELAPAETQAAPPEPSRAERRELARQQKAALKAEREREVAEKKEQARREKESAEEARRAAEEGESSNEAIPMFKAPAPEADSPETSLENPTKPYFAEPGE